MILITNRTPVLSISILHLFYAPSTSRESHLPTSPSTVALRPQLENTPSSVNMAVASTHIISGMQAASLSPSENPMLANKPLAPNPSQVPPTILTQKEWVIPPRPKPGRKPALDAPPTKRKAQNREAQRAFRQRRAAKVGELEDQMKQMEEEDTREQAALREQVARLQNQVDDYVRSMHEWKEKYEWAERQCDYERQQRQNIEFELRMLQEGTTASTEAVKLPSRKSARNASEQAYTEDLPPADPTSLTCGNCSSGSRCQCVEEAIEMSNMISEPASNAKRAHSFRVNRDASKRLRQGGQLPDDEEATEIDFTTTKPPNLASMTSMSASSGLGASMAQPDPCGFCQDGTPCICAEIYRQEEQAPTVPLTNTAVPSISIESTPGPNSCTTNPGTCTQCRSDPRSTLFCKSLAASLTSKISSTNANLSTMAGKPKDSKRALRSAQPLEPANTAATGPTLSCADAFSTLARHPAFDQASVELSSWVPQLATRSVPALASPAITSSDATGTAGGNVVPPMQSGSHPMQGRTAFEIEAASVMGVLRFFDRRFGADGGKREDRKK